MYTIILISILLAINIATLIVLIRHTRQQRKQLQGIRTFMGLMDNRLTKALVTNPIQSPPSPNEATKEEDEIVPLDEQSPWQIPEDVKIEIEGDSSNTPYEYEVTNGRS